MVPRGALRGPVPTPCPGRGAGRGGAALRPPERRRKAGRVSVGGSPGQRPARVPGFDQVALARVQPLVKKRAIHGPYPQGSALHPRRSPVARAPCSLSGLGSMPR